MGSHKQHEVMTSMIVSLDDEGGGITIVLSMPLKVWGLGPTPQKIYSKIFRWQVWWQHRYPCLLGAGHHEYHENFGGRTHA